MQSTFVGALDGRQAASGGGAGVLEPARTERGEPGAHGLRIAVFAEGGMGAIEARSKALGALRAQTGASMAILPAMAEEEMRLTRRVESLANMGDNIRVDYQRARMAEAVEAGDIDVVGLAPLPSTPLLSSAILKVALGLILGLALGLVIAYVLEALNTDVRRPEDLEKVLHVPGLAVIPRITDGSRSAQSHFRRLLGSGKKTP